MSEQILHVTVVYSPQMRVVHEVSLTLGQPCTVSEAIKQSGLAQRYPEIDQPILQIGIWGRKAAAHQTLRDFDRIEIYRPLRVDPKVARRERFIKQGARAVGLFAKRPQGARAGY